MFAKTKKEDLFKIAEELDVVVPSGAKVADLRSLIEQTELFKTDKDFVQNLVLSVVEERTAKLHKETFELEAKLELEKIKLAQLEKEVELETVRNQSRHVTSDFDYNRSVCDLESLIKSVKTLTIPVPAKSEAFNLFFQSLERAFCIKNVPDEYKPEILLNILGEKANNILVFVCEEDMKNYEKLKALVLREFQPTPRDCLKNFEEAERLPNESHMQFASRLSAIFDYYCHLRKVSTFENLSELMVADRLYKTFDADTRSYIGVKQGEDWLKPLDLARECDIYFASNEKSLSEVNFRNKTFGNNEGKISMNNSNRNRKFQRDSPTTQNSDKIKKCFICNSIAHLARFCPIRNNNKNEGIPDMNENAESGKLNENLVSCFHVMNSIDELEFKEIFVDGRKLKVLSDSGATTIVINKNLFPRKQANGSITLSTCFGERVQAQLASFEFRLTHASRPLIFRAAFSDKLTVEGILPPKCLKLLDAHSDLAAESEERENKQMKNPDSVLRSSREKDNTIGENNRKTEAADKAPTADVKEMEIKWIDEFAGQILNVEAEYEEIDLSHVRDMQVKKDLREMITAYSPEKTEKTDVSMKIVLNDDIPVYQRARRLSLVEKQEVDRQISEWLELEIIRPSSSDYASPIVLVKKKDNTSRLCVDYRKLNRKLVKDRFPLPLIEDVLDRLQGANVYTTLDLKNGFFHVNVDENSRKFTSFVVPDGQFEFTKVPFGLSTSPSVFQRYVCSIFRDLTNKGTVVVYMDDLIIPSRDEKEGLEKLKVVLGVASKHGLEIRVKKCQFLRRKVEFLGHVVENGTISPSPAKILAAKRFPTPTNVKQVQSFLGLTGYFRKFILGYSKIAKPLSDLLRKDSPFTFGYEQKGAFEKLKSLLTESPVLTIFKQGRKTELHTDASKHGYGAILMQEAEDGKVHPIYYMSKKTSLAEEKYSSYELEVLAIVEALKKFRVYLLGNHFKIVTDCSAFQKTMDKKDLVTRIARWALLLEEYDYEIEHRPGQSMQHVDALSRYPVMMIESSTLTARLKNAQVDDENICAIKTLLVDNESQEYFVRNDILYKFKDGHELMVAPRSMQTELIKLAHERGHFSTSKTEEVLNQEFFIPNLSKLTENVIKNCVPCILANRKCGKKEGFLNPIPKDDIPLSTYHVDFIGPLPSTNKRYQYILTVIDAFTKFTWLYPVKSVSAEDALDKLKLQQKTFGNPLRIITDRGSAFTSKSFADFCTEEGIQHLQITTGVPRGNGQVERVHRTLIPVLTKLTLDDATKWFKHVDRLQRILNSTTSRSTKCTPFKLLTGVEMRTKEDIKIRDILMEEMVEEFQDERNFIRHEAKKNIEKLQAENKKTFDKKRKKAPEYRVGDLVAIQRTQYGVGLKLRPKFFGPYEITKVHPRDRYEVQKIGDHGGPKTTSTAVDLVKPWGFDMNSEL